MQNKKFTETEKQIALVKAQCEISQFLRTEAGYCDIMETAAMAQSQIINIMDKLSYMPEAEQPVTDQINEFLFITMKALKLLRPFAEIDGTL